MIMTQNDKDLKELLLKDLCARLPYGVKCKMGNYDYIICDISLERQYDVFYNSRRDFRIGVIGTEDNGNTFYTSVYEKHVKPYLFPISSMTEEQREEFLNIQTEERQILLNALIEYKSGKYDKIPIIAPYKQIEWLNKNHFDYRGLIEKGLAIDATNLEIYK